MNIDKILSFCAVVDYGSLSKAAEALYCSQPSLSKQIVALENEIGYPLFDRNGKKMTVNKNGQLLYTFGRHMEKEYNQLKADLFELNHPSRREISFGVTNFIGIYLLPAFLSKFKQMYPDIPVNFSVNFFSNVMDMLQQDVIGFAIAPEYFETLNNNELICQPFSDDEMVVAFPVDHPLASLENIMPQDLLAYPFLISQVNSATRAFILSRFKTHGINLTNMQNMYNTETIKRSIISGMGISILSKTSVANEVENGRLKIAPLQGINMTRKLYLIHKKSHILSPEDSLFINSILKKSNL